MSHASLPVTAVSSPLARRVAVVLLLLLAVAPVYAHLAGNPFVITLLNRVLVLAIAAVSLNLVLGFGGMVSFGHALYLGVGVYAAAIPAFHGIDNGWLQLLITVAGCGLVGLVTGSIVLRTTGIAFIMITLAFAQMFYFLFVSLSQYGGDDGLRLAAGTQFSGLNLGNAQVLYGVSFVLLCAVLYVSHRLVHSRFGTVLRAGKSNPQRMKALGYPLFRYQLAAYVIAAIVCGVAGLLYANLTQFASPSYMAWSMSGELIVMVVLGGMGTLFGPLFGALGMLLAEEWLKSLTEHWMIIFGPLIVLVVSVSRLGIAGLLLRPRRKTSPREPA